MEDFEKAVQAQKDIWGMQDKDLVPLNLMQAMKDFAEQWGAFSDDQGGGADCDSLGLSVG